MSLIRRIDYGTTLEISAGTTKVMELQVENPVTSDPADLTDTNIYNTGKVIILKSDGTEIGTANMTYEDRANGIISFTPDDDESGGNGITVETNAGNWIGKAIFINILGITIDQRRFNFNILEC